MIDVALGDPYIRALEQACGLDFSRTLFQRPQFVCLDGAALPLLDFAAGQLRRGHEPADALVSYQLVSLFMTQLCQLYASATPPLGARDWHSASSTG